MEVVGGFFGTKVIDGRVGLVYVDEVSLTKLVFRNAVFQFSCCLQSACFLILSCLMPAGRVHGQQWTDDDRRKILRLRREGKINREIGELMGRTAAAIQGQINTYRKVFL